MMEEVSVVMQCDVLDMDQMSEEEILACLVAETEPIFTVSLDVAFTYIRFYLLHRCSCSVTTYSISSAKTALVRVL